jgi:SAM-dependent methyltransferase
MKRTLRFLKRAFALGLSRVIITSPLPLAVQTRVIDWLPMDPWPKSLVYQQCLADRIIKANGTIVQRGPFSGMICIRDAREGCLVPKLLGCYEEELAATAEGLMQRGYDRIIDVGCASGYWLTGLALRLRQTEVFGFDIDKTALLRCSQLITLNNVQSRVRLSGACNPADFERLISDRTLIFMDCDGPEYELLDPEAAPALYRADIVVECHDFINPQITSTLRERFRHSHLIETIASRNRDADPNQYPGLRALPAEHWPEALAERRPCVQEWLVMRSRHLSELSNSVSDRSQTPTH